MRSSPSRTRSTRPAAPAACAFLVSAHASLEELFVLRADARRSTGGVTLGWRIARSRSRRTRSSRFRRSTRRTCAARAISASPSATRSGPADVSALQAAVDAGARQGALRLRPGPGRHRSATPTGSSPRARPARSRRSSCRACCTRRWPTRPTSCCRASAFVEKDATYTNMTGHVQASSRAITPPGDAGRRLADPDEARRSSSARTSTYASADAVREAIARSWRPSPATRRSAR